MHQQAQSPFFTEASDCVDLELDKYHRLIHVNIGKGVLVFHQKSKVKFLFNDSNSEIIDIYKSFSNPDFKQEVIKLAKSWQLIEDFSNICSNEIFITFTDYEKNIICLEDLQYMVRAIVLMNTDIEGFNDLFSHSFLVSHDMFINSLIKCTVDQLEKNKGTFFNVEGTDFQSLVEKSFKCGFFNHFQNMLNLQNTNLVDCMDPHKQKAVWYFLSLTSRGNRMVYDANGNLKNLFAGEIQPSDIPKKLKIFDLEENMKIFENIEYHNQPVHIFLSQLNTDKNDLVVADFRNTNLLKSSTREFKQLPLINNLAKLLEMKETNWVIFADFDTSFSSVFGNSQFQLKTVKNNKKDYIQLSKFIK